MNTTINTKRKWLVAALAVMLVIALSFTLVACGTSTATDNKGQSEIGNSGTPMRVALAASPMSLATTASGTTTVSKTITATVLPLTHRISLLIGLLNGVFLSRVRKSRIILP